MEERTLEVQDGIQSGQSASQDETVNGAAAEAAPASLEETLKAEVEAQKSKYMYLYADFENYKKRAFKERTDLLKFGHEGFARDLLQAIDNLERALAHTGDSKDVVIQGIQMVVHQMADTLSRHGITVISTVGQKFNPELHEAVGEELVESDGPQSGTITQEHLKGYTLNGRLLRPARVTVAKQK